MSPLAGKGTWCLLPTTVTSSTCMLPTATKHFDRAAQVRVRLNDDLLHIKLNLYLLSYRPKEICCELYLLVQWHVYKSMTFVHACMSCIH